MRFGKDMGWPQVCSTFLYSRTWCQHRLPHRFLHSLAPVVYSPSPHLAIPGQLAEDAGSKSEAFWGSGFFAIFHAIFQWKSQEFLALSEDCSHEAWGYQLYRYTSSGHFCIQFSNAIPFNSSDHAGCSGTNLWHGGNPARVPLPTLVQALCWWVLLAHSFSFRKLSLFLDISRHLHLKWKQTRSLCGFPGAHSFKWISGKQEIRQLPWGKNSNTSA
jgi:hypothetical protein